MFKLIKTLLTIARELKKIREILEIAFSKEISYYNISKKLSTIEKEKDSDREFQVKYTPDTNIYGEVLEDVERIEEEEISRHLEQVSQVEQTFSGFLDNVKKK